MLPEAGGDELGDEIPVGEFPLHRLGLLNDLRRREAFEVGHSVVVVELDPLKAEVDRHVEDIIEGNGRADGGAEGISTAAEVPGADGKTVVRFGHVCACPRSKWEWVVAADAVGAVPRLVRGERIPARR